MGQQGRELYIGDRLPRFQAAAACLGVGPKVRRAGRYCIIVGGIAALLLFAHREPAAFSLPYLILIGFGVYLYTPDPQPWALPAAGLVILALLAVSIYADYAMYRRFHGAMGGDGLAVIIEIALAVTLLARYTPYKRNRSATDEETLVELRDIATAVSKADLNNDTRIVEWRNDRIRMRRVDGFVLLVTRRYIGFGIYSKLDAVAILKPEMVTLSVVGTPKAGRVVRLRLCVPGKKSRVAKLKPQYLSRVSELGIPITGLPSLSDATPRGN